MCSCVVLSLGWNHFQSYFIPSIGCKKSKRIIILVDDVFMLHDAFMFLESDAKSKMFNIFVDDVFT